MRQLQLMLDLARTGACMRAGAAVLQFGWSIGAATLISIPMLVSADPTLTTVLSHTASSAVACALVAVAGATYLAQRDIAPPATATSAHATAEDAVWESAAVRVGSADTIMGMEMRVAAPMDQPSWGTSALALMQALVLARSSINRSCLMRSLPQTLARRASFSPCLRSDVLCRSDVSSVCSSPKASVVGRYATGSYSADGCVAGHDARLAYTQLIIKETFVLVTILC